MTLAEEAQLYLAVVEVFRAEGCEPRWRREWVEPPVVRPRGGGAPRRRAPQPTERKGKS